MIAYRLHYEPFNLAAIELCRKSDVRHDHQIDRREQLPERAGRRTSG